MSIFTPMSGTIGGSLIGLSAGILLLGNGDILGCSGIVSSIFVKPKETLSVYNEAKWKVLFVSAFLVTSRMIVQYGPGREELGMERQMVAKISTLPVVSNLGFVISGLFVGFGTRLGNGCTTGHGICGMARLSKRSLVAVAVFMSTGVFSASMCSPICKFAKYLRTGVESIDEYFPTESSSLVSSLLIALCGGMTVPLFLSSGKEEGKEEERKNGVNRKGLVAALSGMVFSAGLFVSGMVKNYKIYNFLDMKLVKKGNWDPTLMFVMGSGLLVSAGCYHFVKGHNIFKNDKALTCPLNQDQSTGKFNVPTNRTIDLKLILGNTLFGLGWGIAGLCPGPALFLAANGYPQVIFYWWPSNILGAMLAEKAKKYI